MDVATLGIRVDASGAITVLDQFGNKIDQVSKKTDSFEGKLRKLGAFLAAGWLGHKFFRETILAQEALADLENAVAATGGAAGKTLKELDDLSFKMQRLTRYSDETAKSALSVLLSFTRIRGDQMERVAMAAADLSTRMGRDLVGAAQMLGRAMQDPERGIMMINRQFRLFDEEQVRSITLMAQTGQAARAQEIILAALESRFKGAALASRGTLGGALDYLKNTFGDLFEVSKGGTSLLVAGINKLGDALIKVQPHMSKILSIVIALTAAWVAYVVASKAVVLWNGIIAAGQTVAAFISLAKAIRSVADGMALLQMVGLGGVKVVATLAALAVGFVAYKKILAELNEEFEEWTKNLAGGGGAATGTDTGDPNRERNFAAQMAVAETTARNLLDVQKELLKTRGQETLAIKAFRIEQEMMLKNAEALLRFNNKEINESERDRLIAHNGRMRQIAIETAKIEEQVGIAKKVWENLTTGLQSTFSTFFEDVFSRGVKSFNDLTDAIKRLWFRMLAELVASRVMQFILKALSGGNDKSAAAQQMSAAAAMIGAAQQQERAADKMLAASGASTPSSTSAPAPGGGVGMRTKLGIGAGIATAGFSVGYGVGSMFGGNRTMGAVGGALSGAATGAALGSVVPVIGTAVGAVVGGLAGLVGGLFGAGKAAKEKREQMRLLEVSYKNFTNTIKEQLGVISPLEKTVADTKLQFNEMRKQLSDKETTAEFLKVAEAMKKMGLGDKKLDDLIAKMRELDSLEQQRIAQLQQEAAAQRKWAKDNIEVRRLEAMGQSKEAAQLRMRIQHEQEYAEAVKQGLDATTLAQLRHVQALELQKAAADAFTSAALNVPEGYKIAAAAFAALGTTPGTSTPGGTGRGPRPGRRTLTEHGDDATNTTIVLTLDGREVARSTVRNLQRMAAAQNGNSTRWAEVTVT